MDMNRLVTAYGSNSVDYKSYKALKDYADTGKECITGTKI